MSINVLVIDDSALIRAVLSEIIKDAPGLHLVGTAKNAFQARDMVNQHKPDVITLDIEMPEMNGLAFLEKLMRAHPTAVIMISSSTSKGSAETLKSMELGAVDFVEKPTSGIAVGLGKYKETLIEKIKNAANAKIKQRKLPKLAHPLTISACTDSRYVIGIGASTGGTEAIKDLLVSLPQQFPPIVITQHMPSGFTTTFAQRLNAMCKICVKEAQNHEILRANTAYIAPGDRHMTIQNSANGMCIKLQDGPLVSGHKPSVDVMFDSLAKTMGQHTVAAILTGMGKDGAKGLLHIKQAGGKTFAQDEESSVVFGMPREAIKLKAAQEVVPLAYLGQKIRKVLQ
ncbi:protein-glutamate methylesterase/protein-glutamine glutaminase [Opacimonas viscosa]|uniref:Protein-glutamate methylesterase/protein-glutamine glutaminase n=1 Tax=Opacimonas viscosa TaxID=2961944 RepID=A0AA42BMA0_9ALTE|nr:chemotaxis response regulator protein-glutamate methylesterase [Opacimonas viscosa]MCP3428407.1 chemotaxis response regulator protein-glutamate methylesterase [Opacimonas viscosa]